MQIMLRYPLIVIEYFHTTMNTILSTLIKDGLFGELVHHYGTIEYQGWGTPHIHLLVLSILIEHGAPPKAGTAAAIFIDLRA